MYVCICSYKVPTRRPRSQHQGHVGRYFGYSGGLVRLICCLSFHAQYALHPTDAGVEMLTNAIHFRYIQLSVYLSVYLSIYLYIYPSTYLSVYLSIYLPIFLSVYLSSFLSVYLSVYLSAYLSVYLIICLSFSLSIHPWFCQSIYLSVHLSVYLSVYLSIHVLVCLFVCFLYLYTYTYIYIYVYTYTYVRVFICPTIDLSVHPLSFPEIGQPVCQSKRLSADLSTNVYMYICIDVPVYIAYVHTYTICVLIIKYVDPVGRGTSGPSG